MVIFYYTGVVKSTMRNLLLPFSYLFHNRLSFFLLFHFQLVQGKMVCFHLWFCVRNAKSVVLCHLMTTDTVTETLAIRVDIVAKSRMLLDGLPRPINILKLFFMMFYFLLSCLVYSWKLHFHHFQCSCIVLQSIVMFCSSIAII